MKTVTTESVFPPKGLLKKKASVIAKVLARKSVSPKGIGSAIKFLQFFINRGGKGLSKTRKIELERAKRLLQKKKCSKK